jgi:hypothetical protein
VTADLVRLHDVEQFAGRTSNDSNVAGGQGFPARTCARLITRSRSRKTARRFPLNAPPL